MAINRVILTGRLTKDVELRATPSGANVVSFTVAVDSYGKDQNGNQNQASFVNCVAWNNQAKFLSQYCKKGNLLAIDGRLQTRSYDRKDGTKAYVTEVVAERVENLSPRDGTSMNESASEYQDDVDNENEDMGISFSDDDLPF